ncbi:MAG: hypothetical protein UR12_C0006G0019 [candidate division TM6 bacterium GW2011_GWF2_30_66]|jgi:hypothetical protein|nr:MAG: hypothetical protein UR12_C0006G0019 [candidate division TM6 bacterium GW2011_GWF2_30_66]
MPKKKLIKKDLNEELVAKLEKVILATNKSSSSINVRKKNFKIGKKSSR